MKTPVEELFEKLWDTDKDKLTWRSILNTMLDKEKEVIMNAYRQGVVDEYGDTLDSRTITEAEDYYNDIFNTKQE